MCCDSRMGRCVAMISVALFSLVLVACGGGGGGGGSTTNYTVTTTAGAGGNISPASAIVSSGATTSFTVTPDSGSSINTVTGCSGALVGTTYTTGAVSADCTVTASFVSNGVPTVSIADASIAEGDSGTTNLNFTVSLSAPASGNVDVDYGTSDGSATAGSDYTAISSGTLTITAGNTSGTVTVSVTGDTTVESNETFTLTLSNPTGATLGTAAATGTITNDDSAPALPTISIADASVIEGDSSTTNLIFTVTLSALANGNVDVDYDTSASSATAGSDYTTKSGTLTIPAGSTSATVSISVLGDTTAEGSENFTIALANATPNATLGTPNAATGTILNDDVTGILNDTGMTGCADNTSGGLACPQSGFPGQDAEYGRDVTANDDSDGLAGFSYVKLDSSGTPLANQSVLSTTPWDCVLDTVTGLIWEVKTNDGGLRDGNHTYTWYNSTGINDGGASGTANGGVCVDAINCDTEKYVAAVNAVGLCGHTDWRMPTVGELDSLVDNTYPPPNPTIDIRYFPNTQWLSPGSYWSSSPDAGFAASGRAWIVYFSLGAITGSPKSNPSRVRLVHGGP